MKNAGKKMLAFVLVLSLALGVFAGCASTSKDTASKDDEKTGETIIRVAHFPFAIWNDQFIIAYEKGFFDEVFAEDNVKIQVSEFENGPAANEAFLSGQIDFVNGIGDQPIVIGIGNGVETTIVSGAAKQGANIGIISPKDAGISKAEDLKGKRIGVFVGTYVHKSLIGILSDAGIDEKDVDIVNITSTSDADAAFESGDIDAYLAMSSYYIHTKVEDEGFVKIADCSNHAAYSYDVVSNEFMENHPELLEKFMKALYRAEQWINKNQQESYEIIAEYAGIDIERAQYTNQDAVRTLVWDEDYEKNLEETYEFLKSHQLITNELTEDDIKSHINTGFLEKAIE